MKVLVDYSTHCSTTCSSFSFDLMSCSVSLRGILLAEYKILYGINVLWIHTERGRPLPGLPSCISDFQVSADSTKLVLGSCDICLLCFMKNVFKKQSAKFVQNPSSFTKVMAKHILVCFYAPRCS